MKKLLLLLFPLLVLTACSSGSSETESEQANNPAKQQTKVTFSLVADEGVNPSIWGEASPIEIQVFELQDDSMFMSADYDQLKNDYEDALKSNYVKSYDYVLMPGQFKFVDSIPISKETHYIGVVAHFADPELSEWKKAVKVINKGRIYHLLMLFKDYNVKLKRVE
ncbi:MAG: type VI secretion system lipoprotein TssJ [Vibrio sp.]